MTFWLSALVTIGLFLIPAFIIRPFSYQNPRALWVAMALKQWAPILTVITAAFCIVSGYALWTRLRGWRRILPAFVFLIAMASATMAHQNYFEWMFHPVRQPGFEAATQTKLDEGEMVLAVTFNNDARAYPIREMAYHHIVNDLVGGVPVAVTY